MKSQKSFAWQSFLAILAVIALLLAAVYFLAPGAFPMSKDVLLLGGAGLVAALVLWFIVRALGNGTANDVLTRLVLIGTHLPAPCEVR